MMEVATMEVAVPKRGPRNASRVVGIVLLSLVVLSCILGPMVWPYGPSEIVGPLYQAPGWSHPFGTDAVGRDVFIRTLQGGRLDLTVAVSVVGISCLIGTLIGTSIGSARGRGFEMLTMRLIDGVISFPFLILILAIIAVVGPTWRLGPLPSGVPALIVALLLVDWAIYARLARNEARALRERDYVVAAELLGYSKFRVTRRHVLPAVWRTTAAFAVSDLILVIIVTASLAFVGAGVQPPTPEWGAIMYEGRTVLSTAWWITILPGAVVVTTGLGMMLLADSLLVGGRGRLEGG